MTDLVERLGYPRATRVVIINCDDLGSSHAANVGVYRALREGAATAAGLMVTAPWARHAAAEYLGEDVGVHLTLNAEHAHYRWGPITHAPSLMSGEGGFPRTIDDLWNHADPEEVWRECRTQVERAIAWGFDITHLSPHLTAMTLRPEFFSVYVDLAAEFRLPIRLPSTLTEQQVGFPFRAVAAAEGVLFPDHFDHDWRPGSRARVLRQLTELEPGVTEIHLQPAADTPEVRAISDDALGWIDDLDFITSAEMVSALQASGAEVIGYRPLREAMRAA